MRFYSSCFSYLLLSFISVFSFKNLFAEGENTYILVNSRSAYSEQIAQYYSEKRLIPKDNILRMEMPLEEVISISEYIEHIHNPLIELLLDKGIVQGVLDASKDELGRLRLSAAMHTIDYLVLTKGIPLKFSKQFKDSVAPKSYINSLKKDQASVDSELSALLFNRFYALEGFIENPIFLEPIANSSSLSKLIRVSRLDAPSLEAVLRLIEDSIFAENYGLRGRAYFDLGGPYRQGNDWLLQASKIVEDLYYELEIENTKNHFDYAHRFDAPAIYMGWYLSNINAQWRNTAFSMPRGSIAYHLHSFSAGSLKKSKKGWVAGLIERGFSASFGYVYEPLLSLTVRPDLFMKALSTGQTLGEAYYFSNPALSWQSILIGDPLYRPFKKSLEAQLRDNFSGLFGNYAYLNQFNLELETLGAQDAIANAYKNIQEHFSYALLFKLANVLYQENRYEEAVNLLGNYTFINRYSVDQVYIIFLIADLLNRLGQAEQSLTLTKHLIERHSLPKKLEIKLLQSAVSVSDSVGDLEFSSKSREKLSALGMGI
jgi:uncharacterized protein (TIGR03790 family)